MRIEKKKCESRRKKCASFNWIGKHMGGKPSRKKQKGSEQYKLSTLSRYQHINIMALNDNTPILTAIKKALRISINIIWSQRNTHTHTIRREKNETEWISNKIGFNSFAIYPSYVFEHMQNEKKKPYWFGVIFGWRSLIKYIVYEGNSNNKKITQEKHDMHYNLKLLSVSPLLRSAVNSVELLPRKTCTVMLACLAFDGAHV